MIRRRTHCYRVTKLSPAESVGKCPEAFYVTASNLDLQRLVVVRYVDFRTRYREGVGGVVKFSAKGESPDVTRDFRLATPAHFRETGYEPGIADDLEPDWIDLILA